MWLRALMVTGAARRRLCLTKYVLLISVLKWHLDDTDAELQSAEPQPRQKELGWVLTEPLPQPMTFHADMKHWRCYARVDVCCVADTIWLHGTFSLLLSGPRPITWNAISNWLYTNATCHRLSWCFVIDLKPNFLQSIWGRGTLISTLVIRARRRGAFIGATAL